MKVPLLFMTGHDPSMVRRYNIMGSQYGGGKLDGKLSETEIIALQKYLVAKGGYSHLRRLWRQCTRTSDGPTVPCSDATCDTGKPD